MSTLHGTLYGIRMISEKVYEVDIDDSVVRAWYRIEVGEGVIVPKKPLSVTHVWLLRSLGQAFAAYLRGKKLEFPIDLGPP